MVIFHILPAYQLDNVMKGTTGWRLVFVAKYLLIRILVVYILSYWLTFAGHLSFKFVNKIIVYELKVGHYDVTP